MMKRIYGKYMLRLFLMMSCSFLLALPISMDKKQRMSTNGCSSDIYSNMSHFYEEPKDSLDVIVLGDSNVYRAFSPLVYWKDQNITSYSLATATQPAWLSYYVLQDALAYQKPKVVVFEINELFASPTGKTSRYCSTINTMHSDSARLHAIADTTSGFDREDRKILYQNYVLHHYQKDIHPILTQTKSKKASTPSFKGYLLNMTTLPFMNASNYMSRYDFNMKVDERNINYIDKIIALCNEQHIELLFVKFPTKEWTNQKSKLATKFAQERNIPLFDMNTSFDGIDWMKDTKDSGFHMNDAGAEKTTIALANFINQYVTLKPTQDENMIHSFQTALKRYEKLRSHSEFLQEDIQ